MFYTTNEADFSDHMFCIHAAIILNDAKILYREAWRLRRIMFAHARDNASYRHFWGQLQNIKHASDLGKRIVEHVEATAHRTLGTFAS